MKILLPPINNYLMFFGMEGVIEDNKISSIQKNAENTPYFELKIESEYNIVYSINISKRKVFEQNIAITNKKNYSLLFTLLKIDLEGITDLIKEDLYAEE